MQNAKIESKEGKKMYREGFTSKLKKARNDTGFTQREVAKETKIPQKIFPKVESNFLYLFQIILYI